VTLVIVLVSIAAGIGIGFVVLLLRLRRLRDSVIARVEQRLGAERVRLMEKAANGFGLESAGPAQVRGTGCLAATDREILFVMWAPRREIEIRRERVTAVTTVRSHLGKSRGTDLLRVEYRDKQGREDAAAWQVSDLDRWLDLLGGTRAG
jgi:hypothetical protein